MANLLFSPTSLTVLTDPRGENLKPRCGLCGFHKRCKSPKIKTGGEGRKKIMILMEAPGANEDDQNEHLVGKSGKFLQKALWKMGIDVHKDCWIENAIICRPPIMSDAAVKAIDYCRPNLINRLGELKPEVVLAFGNGAIHSIVTWLWGHSASGVDRWAGYQIPAQQINAWVCPTYHPGDIMEEKDPVPGLKWMEQMKAAVGLRGRPFTKLPDYEAECEVVYDTDEAARRIRSIKKGVVAFDYETNCLKPDQAAAKIYSCSVCYADKWTIAFPWDGKVVKEMKRLLADPKVKKIASNAKFEDRWTRSKVGVEVRGWMWDTMLVAHALENSTKVRPITSIKFQAFVKLGQKDWSATVDEYLHTKGNGNTINNIHQIAGSRELLTYNAMDSLLEYKVAMLQMAEMGFNL